MIIQQILEKIKSIKLHQGNENFDVGYVYSDSRKLTSKDVFCVYDSFGEDTISYLNDSALKKVEVVLINKSNKYFEHALKFKTVLVVSKDAMNVHGYLASLLLDNPSKKLKVIAVTGTNGKTSTTNILYNLFDKEKKNAGLIGTIHAKYGKKIVSIGYTTPEPSELNQLLKDMLDYGVEYVFIEASSIGLKLGRLNGIQVYAAIFTNLTPDHLDFHKNMDDYLESKLLLFKLLNKSKYKNKFAILSYDSPGGKELYKLLQNLNPNFSIFRLGKNCEYEGELTKLSLHGIEFELREKNGRVSKFMSNLLGNFNYYNLALSILTCIKMNFSLENMSNHIQNIPFVDGRFQVIYSPRKNRVGIVDYAHTPDALENMLTSLKQIPHTKLICVFGCGGDRDPIKRPLMGNISLKYADYVILTSDNPRTENPDKILDDIEKGMDNKKNYLRITDRKLAIRKGVEILPDNGFLLIAGKGHENYQIIGKEKRPFSDISELQQALASDENTRK